MISKVIVPVTVFQQNCSILMCNETKKAVIIDPGGDIQLIIAEVNKLGCQLQQILLTHGHIDHIGASKILSEQYEVPILGPHKADQFWFEGVNDYASLLQMSPIAPFLPDRWLDEGDQIICGNLVFDVLHCPGHTPGHLVFVERNASIASVGDVLFQGSVGRTDLPGGDHATLIRSIKTKLLPLGDGMGFIPGHGPQSTMGFEKVNNPFLQ